MELEILKYPHPCLMRKCAEVKRVDSKLLKIMDVMIDLCESNNGIGLAANQVGYPLRFFVAKIDETYQSFINPVIISRHGKYMSSIEGCLSTPGLNLNIPRQRKIKYEAYDRKGNRLFGTLKGLQAVLFTHEYDHLDGIMFFNHIDPTNAAQIEQVGTYMSNLNNEEIDIDKAKESMQAKIEEYGS